jgi:hypothetical protein
MDENFETTTKPSQIMREVLVVLCEMKGCCSTRDLTSAWTTLTVWTAPRRDLEDRD